LIATDESVAPGHAEAQPGLVETQGGRRRFERRRSRRRSRRRLSTDNRRRSRRRRSADNRRRRSSSLIATDESVAPGHAEAQPALFEKKQGRLMEFESGKQSITEEEDDEQEEDDEKEDDDEEEDEDDWRPWDVFFPDDEDDGES